MPPNLGGILSCLLRYTDGKRSMVSNDAYRTPTILDIRSCGSGGADCLQRRKGWSKAGSSADAAYGLE